MDIRRDGFFGYLTLNGRSIGLVSHTGSVISLVGESLKTLATERARLADGELEIVLQIRNKPLNTSPNNTLTLGTAEEVSALVEGDADQPQTNESYEDFYHRLIAQDYSQPSAEYIAAQWFGREVSPTTTLWLNDPKAVRFRELNSRDEAYQTALPTEYESLKHYVQTTYPEFVEHLVFRTA